MDNTEGSSPVVVEISTKSFITLLPAFYVSSVFVLVFLFLIMYFKCDIRTL